MISTKARNAIKYSPDGDQVIFNLVCQPDKAIFRIQDFGIGVPASEQNELFDSFYRAGNVSSIPGGGGTIYGYKKYHT